jgi:hypothetical protein
MAPRNPSLQPADEQSVSNQPYQSMGNGVRPDCKVATALITLDCSILWRKRPLTRRIPETAGITRQIE